jgi:hypothetical protein
MRLARLRWLPLLLGLLLALPAAADDLAGRYQAQGTTPKGQPYQGEVQIEQLGSLHVILWKLADGAAYKGIGIRQGDVLGAAYGGGKAKFGLVIYRIDGGTLTGVWADSRDLKSELGKETLQGSADLSGTYKITLGQNRDGMTNYGGQVAIKRSGETYILVWPAKPPAIGVGVRVNDLLVVAYGADPHKLPGVVAYQATGEGTLSGIWAAAGISGGGNNFNITTSSKVGREDLTRMP